MTSPIHDPIELLIAQLVPASLRVEDLAVEDLSSHPLVRRFQLLDAASVAVKGQPVALADTIWYLHWLKAETAFAVMQDESAITAVMEVESGNDWSNTLPARLMRTLRANRPVPLAAPIKPVNTNALGLMDPLSQRVTRPAQRAGSGM